MVIDDRELLWALGKGGWSSFVEAGWDLEKFEVVIAEALYYNNFLRRDEILKKISSRTARVLYARFSSWQAPPIGVHWLEGNIVALVILKKYAGQLLMVVRQESNKYTVTFYHRGFILPRHIVPDMSRQLARTFQAVA